MTEANASVLSDDQRAVYDRQLRVWGLETQHRLSAARVLLIGTDGLSAEVKLDHNAVLVGPLTFAAMQVAKAAAHHNHGGQRIRLL